MKKIILSLFLLTSSFCFGDWPKYDEVTFENFADHNRLFMIPKNVSSEGINIAAFERTDDFQCLVCLRYNKNIVDYIIYIFEQTCDSSSFLYLQLLDLNDFLVEKKFVSKLCPCYKGTLRGSFSMSFEEFKKIKKFDLSFSG